MNFQLIGVTKGNSPKCNSSWKNKANANCSSGSSELESIPDAWNEICTQEDGSNEPNSDQRKPQVVQN